MVLTRATALQGQRARRRTITGAWSEERRGGVYRGSGTETFVILMPGTRSSRVLKPPVVYCHGGGGIARDIYNSPLSGVAGAFLAAGFPVIAADLGGTFTWGNDDTQLAIDQAIAYSASIFGTRTDRIVIWCDSMGGTVGLPWAAHNITRIAFIYAQVPVVGLAALRTNPLAEASFGAGIDTAFGGNAGYLAALPTHDPGAVAQTGPLVGLGERLRIDADLQDIYMLHSQYDTYMTAVPYADFRWYPGNHFFAREHDHNELSWWVSRMADSYA